MKLARKEKKVPGEMIKRPKAKTKINKGTKIMEKEPLITDKDTTPMEKSGGKIIAIIATHPDILQGAAHTTLIGTSVATSVTTLVISKVAAELALRLLLEEWNKRPNTNPEQEATTAAKEEKQGKERKEKVTAATKEKRTAAQMAWTQQEGEQEQ